MNRIRERRGSTSPGSLRTALDLLNWLILAVLYASAIGLGLILAAAGSGGSGQ